MLAAIVASLFVPIVISITFYRNTNLNSAAIALIGVIIFFLVVFIVFLIMKYFVREFGLQSASNTVRAFNKMHELAKKKEDN